MNQEFLFNAISRALLVVTDATTWLKPGESRVTAASFAQHFVFGARADPNLG